jgi:diphthamide synthase (EF-2-diphthine--ammonia ligase)
MQKNEEINRMPKIVAFSSGGKDSMYALYLALNNEINVDYLLFVKNGSKAHRLNSWLLELVSETLEIPAVTTDKDMPAIRKTLQKLKADMIISGVMISTWIGTTRYVNQFKLNIMPHFGERSL